MARDMLAVTLRDCRESPVYQRLSAERLKSVHRWQALLPRNFPPAPIIPTTSNPQWVRLLNLLQMNVRYQRCSGSELYHRRR